MKKRVPASEQTRKRIEELISGVNGKAERSDLVKFAAQLIIEEALESEVQAELGREYYARGDDGGPAQRLSARQARFAPRAASSMRCRRCAVSPAGAARCVEALSGRSEELERLAIEMYARGLSVRDIEAAFVDESGRCVLSKSAVSLVTERLWTDYQALRAAIYPSTTSCTCSSTASRSGCTWASRAKRCSPPGALRARETRCYWGCCPGTKEDTVSCKEFLRDLKSRGLADPLLVVTDGAPGLIRAVEEVFPAELTTALSGAPDQESGSQGTGGVVARG